MTINDIREHVLREFSGVTEKFSYSETTFFYNPGGKLPNGVYFLTIKENDGPNDKASDLGRDGIFRVSFKPSPAEYEEQFGSRPARPGKGEIVDLDYDFTKENSWMPHPIYSWMGWTMILSPTAKAFQKLTPHVEWAYLEAKAKFEKKTK